MSVASGSQLAAGKSVATLRLARGGEVRLCPATSLTVSVVSANVPQATQELMLSMDTGSVEFDYPLNDLADTLVTPDFKFMLAGPGVFHFALGVNSRGDTCVKPLRGNSASVIVSEMVGSAVYQVKPEEAVIFPAGKLSGRAPLEGECGCPPPLPVIQAENQEPKPAQPSSSVPPKTSETSAGPEPATNAESAKSMAANQKPPVPDVTAPLPAEKPDAVHVQVDVPLVFRGDQPQPAFAIARIKFSALPNINLPQENQKPIVLKPGKGEVSAKNKEKKGVFAKIKGFFAAIFH